jgi:short chain dehydrogenase
MPAQELSGTTALVTGASRGFGRAIAVALSKHGAHVAGVARDHGRLEELRAPARRYLHPRSPPTPPTPWSQASSSTSTAPARWSSTPGRLPCRGRSAGKPGRPSAATGRSTCSTCSTGPARRCCFPCSQAAWSSPSPAEPRSTARHSAAATPEPRPPTVHRLLRRRRVGPERARHQVPLRAAAAHSGNRTGHGRSRRLRRQAGRRYPRLPRPPRPGAHPRAGGHRDRRHCHRLRR